VGEALLGRHAQDRAVNRHRPRAEALSEVDHVVADVREVVRSKLVDAHGLRV
jgi:hypothetical protein